jgi:hypothetical protein
MPEQQVLPQAVMGMWKKLSSQDHVFVVYADGLPYIENPENIPQMAFVPEGSVESLVMAFLTREGADQYKSFLIELHEEIRPSDFHIEWVNIGDLLKMVEELEELSIGMWGCNVRVDVAGEYGEDSVVADTLYSKYLLKN